MNRADNRNFNNYTLELTGAFWLLLSLAALGVLLGSVLAVNLNTATTEAFHPLLFSAIPQSSSFFICFSAFLLNLLIFLIVSLLLGLTVFGAVAIPVLSVLKGVALGIDLSYFLITDGPLGLLKSALIYIPATAISLIIFVLFEVQSLGFSENLRKAGFSSAENTVTPADIARVCLRYVCLAVAASAIGGAVSSFGLSFLSLLAESR